jgi:hypothetical protein
VEDHTGRAFSENPLFLEFARCFEVSDASALDREFAALGLLHPNVDQFARAA